MAQLVNVPGVGQLSFPDGMSQQDMASAIQKNFPQLQQGHQKSDWDDDSPSPPQQGQTQPDDRSVLQKVGDFVNGNLYNVTGTYFGDQAPNPNTMGGFVTAANHNLVKPFHGLAQLVEHGVGAAADLIDPNYTGTRTISQIAGPQPRSGWNKALHDTIAQDDKAMIDWENNYQKSTPNSIASNTGAVVGSVAPFLASGVSNGLNAIGDAAASIVPKFAPSLVPKIVSGAAQGGVLALSNPVTADGDYWDEKKKQIGVGGAIGGAIPVLGAAAKGLYNVVKPIVNPNGVVSDALAEWIPGGAKTLDDVKELVPGSKPTTAQVVANPDIVAAEKALSNNPTYKPLFDARANANNEARLATLADIAKTPNDLEAAIQARTDATAPWRDEAFKVPQIPVWRQNLADAGNAVKEVLDKSPRMSSADFDALQKAKTWIGSAQRGNIDSQTLYNNLASLEVTSKTAAKTIQKAGAALQNNGNLVDATPVLQQLRDLQMSSLGTDPIVRKGAADLAKSIQEGIENTGEGATLIRPDLLDGYRQNVKNILKQYASNGAVGTKQEAAFKPIRDAIVDSIDRTNPGYSNYLETFAQKSVPINTMEAGQSILDSLAGSGRNSVGDAALTLSKITNQINQATRGPYGIAPDAEAALRGVQEDLQRASISNSVRSAGSDTAYNLQAPGWLGRALYGDNFKGGALQKSIGAFIGGGVGSTGGPAAAAVGAKIGWDAAGVMTNFAQKRVNEVLAEALLDPAKAQALLQESQVNPMLQKLLQNAPSASILLGEQLSNKRPANSLLVPVSKRGQSLSGIANAQSVDEAIHAAQDGMTPELSAELSKISATRRGQPVH